MIVGSPPWYLKLNFQLNSFLTNLVFEPERTQIGSVPVGTSYGFIVKPPSFRTFMRGAGFEWLVLLGYGAESPRFEAGLAVL